MSEIHLTLKEQEEELENKHFALFRFCAPFYLGSFWRFTSCFPLGMEQEPLKPSVSACSVHLVHFPLYLLLMNKLCFFKVLGFKEHFLHLRPVLSSWKASIPAARCCQQALWPVYTTGRIYKALSHPYLTVVARWPYGRIGQWHCPSRGMRTNV